MTRTTPLAVLAALPVLFTTRRAAAVDPFEIQVYDGTANNPGVPGIELHVNRVFDGVRTALPPELPMHHQSHFTLEPSLGVLPFLELGGYFQTALNADGSFDYAGTKLRAKLVTPPGWHEHVRLGLNTELSLLPERYDRQSVGRRAPAHRRVGERSVALRREPDRGAAARSARRA